MANKRKRKEKETSRFQPRKRLHPNATKTHKSFEQQSVHRALQRPGNKVSSAKIHNTTHNRATMPFESGDHVLLVGEGDFSFALSLYRHHPHSFASLTATSLESRAALLEKHPQAENFIDEMTRTEPTIYSDDDDYTSSFEGFSNDEQEAPKPIHNGSKHQDQDSDDDSDDDEDEETETKDHSKPPVKVLYNIDATKLHTYPALRKHRPAFTKIAFNFPHVGGRSTDVNRQVRYNQALVHGFFESCLKLLSGKQRQSSRDGKADMRGRADVMDKAARREPSVLVTLFEGEPYTLWNVRDLGRSVGLVVKRSWAFDAGVFPGYSHARTVGNLWEREGSRDEENGAGEGEQVREESGKRKKRWKGEERSARTYEFGLKEGVDGGGSGLGTGRKRKRGAAKQGESSDEA